MKTPMRTVTAAVVLMAVVMATGCAQHRRPEAANTIDAPATRPVAVVEVAPPSAAPMAPAPAAVPPPPPPRVPGGPVVGRYQPLPSAGGGITILDTATGTVWTYGRNRDGAMEWTRITLPAGEGPQGGQP